MKLLVTILTLVPLLWMLSACTKRDTAVIAAAPMVQARIVGSAEKVLSNPGLQQTASAFSGPFGVAEILMAFRCR